MTEYRNRGCFDGIASMAAALCLAMLVDTAAAGERRYVVNDATYLAECGSCHLAYPPALLGGGAWREIMRGLQRHFGADASIGAAEHARISAYLEAGAGRFREPASTLRISETSWFRKEHRGVPAATWKSPAVKSAANCGACHRQAEQGRYDEHGLVMPGPEAK